ncbi:MAG: hypothetical protein WC821_03620 [archaeon]
MGLANKIEQNNSKYKGWWFIVTNKDDKEQYAWFNQTLKNRT